MSLRRRETWLVWTAALLLAAVVSAAVVRAFTGAWHAVEWGSGLGVAAAAAAVGLFIDARALESRDRFVAWALGGHGARVLGVLSVLLAVWWDGRLHFPPFGVTVAVGWLVFMLADVILLARANMRSGPE